MLSTRRLLPQENQRGQSLCIIPARGGSKRIPRKNIKPFCGKPMISWSIEVARRSGCFDHIIVSTDDEEIAEISLHSGAAVPFKRPLELADDYATTRHVVNHAITEAKQLYGSIGAVCCLYATAPFVTVEDLRKGMLLLSEESVDFVFTSATFAHPVQRAFRQTKTGGLERIQPEHRSTRSQDLEETFHDAGQFYWGSPDAFLLEKDTISEKSRALVLPRFRVHDIDTEEDWLRAEVMFTALHQHRV